MNARKVVCVVCVLVVGLLLLQGAALAGPPNVDRVGEVPLYGPEGYPVAPKVSVPLYRAEDSKLPNFYRGWSNAQKAAPRVDWLWKYPLYPNQAPSVPVPQYRYNGKLPWAR
jgi:hypothetical protein